MEKLTNNFSTKLVAILLSTTILLGFILPINAFATTNNTKNFQRSMLDVSNYSENIIREVE